MDIVQHFPHRLIRTYLQFTSSICHFCHPPILLALITYPNNVRWLLVIIKLVTVYFVRNLATSSSSGQNAFLELLFWYTFNISLLSYFLKVTNCPKHGRDQFNLYGTEYDRCKNMKLSFSAERLKGVCSSLGLPLARRESTLGWSVRLLDHLDGSHVRTRLACYRPDVWPVTACPRVFVQVQLLHYVLQRDHIQRMASKTGVNSTSVRELYSGAGFMQNWFWNHNLSLLQEIDGTSTILFTFNDNLNFFQVLIIYF